MSDVDLNDDSAKTFGPEAPQANQAGVSKIEAPSAHTGSWEARSIRFKHWRKGTGSEGVAQEILHTITTSTDEKAIRVAFGMLNHITATQRAEFVTKFHNYVEVQNLGPEHRICQLFSSVLGDIKDKKLMGDLKSIGQEIADIRPKEDKTKIDKIAGLIEVIETSTTPTAISVAIRNLVGAGYNVNVRIKGSNTLLHLACENNNIEAVKSLLIAGANPNIRDINGNTPLHLACNSGNVELVKALLDAKNPKADPNIRDRDGNTPLLLACINGNVEIAEALLKNKADPNIKGEFGNTPSHVALENCDRPVYQALLKAKPNLSIANNAGITPHELFRDLPQRTRQRDIDNFFELTNNPATDKKAIEEAYEKVFQHIGDINNRILNGSSLLHHACANNNLRAVGFLLAKKANLNILDQDGNTPLHLAYKEQHQDIVNTLLKLENIKRDIKNKNGLTPLEFGRMYEEPPKIDESEQALIDLINNKKATKEAIKDSIKALIESNHNINVPFLRGESLLHLACAKGNITAIEALLEAGANPNIQDRDGNTPLHLACKKPNYKNSDKIGDEHKKLVDALLNAKADPNIQDRNGNTPLLLACNKSIVNFDVVKALLDKKANPNIRGKLGDTPLYLAFQSRKNEEVVMALLSRRAVF